MNLKAFEEFCKLNNTEYKKNEPMSEHTTFKTGGNADLFVNVKNTEELKMVISEAKKDGIPVFCIGKGSNLLVLDGGIEGIVLSLAGIDSIKISDGYLTAGAGASLAAVCLVSQHNSLSGLEFAYGIPGSVGGALFMNAGAYGGEISNVIYSACVADTDGNVFDIKKDDMNLGYRKSIFKDKGYYIVSATFKLNSGSKEDIKEKMDGFLLKRKEKQPLEYPSAGSTFKRPEGHFAGALIEKNGLKGLNIGGAKVSEKHAGFIINAGNATSDDICKLMERVKQKVYEADNVMLEPEVIIIGKERK